MATLQGLGEWLATGAIGALLMFCGDAAHARNRGAARAVPQSNGSLPGGQSFVDGRNKSQWQSGNSQYRNSQFNNGQTWGSPYNQSARGQYLPPPQAPVARNYNNAYNYDFPVPRPAYNTAPTSTYSRPVVNTLPSAPTVRSLPTPAATAAVAVPTANRQLTLRETAAALLLAQARTATWEVYEHFEQNANYAETYREMHKFLQAVKSISTETTRQAQQQTVSTTLANALREAEVSLQVLQIQTAGWQRDAGAPVPSEQNELALQFERMVGTLEELMTASDVAPQDFAAVDDAADTPIRARQ